MLTSITIRNYKSIESVTLELGRVNVLIGENGAGKSNILEAIALAGAASAGKLDNEFLTSRGIRVTDPKLMRSAFAEGTEDDSVQITLKDGENIDYIHCLLNDNTPYGKWILKENKEFSKSEFMFRHIEPIINEIYDETETTESEKFIDAAILFCQRKVLAQLSVQFTPFLIYSPENSSLRLFEREGQILPLGINGEGLFKLLRVLSQDEDTKAMDSIRQGLKLFGWFEDFGLAEESVSGPRGIRVRDRFLTETRRVLDQKSVNEGFLFVLFYCALFSTKLTPPFFAIDNIDASLNPKLCQELVRTLAGMARENDKQVIMTTHNPAILDGLNLDDDDQRLFVISRNPLGETQVRRIMKPRPIEGAPPVRLSEMFLRGVLGGLPKGF